MSSKQLEEQSYNCEGWLGLGVTENACLVYGPKFEKSDENQKSE